MYKRRNKKDNLIYHYCSLKTFFAIITNKCIRLSDLVKKNIIKEIVIGPRSQVKENDVYYLLMANGYSFQDISVGKSSATYRWLL